MSFFMGIIWRNYLFRVFLFSESSCEYFFSREWENDVNFFNANGEIKICTKMLQWIWVFVARFFGNVYLLTSFYFYFYNVLTEICITLWQSFFKLEFKEQLVKKFKKKEKKRFWSRMKFFLWKFLDIGKNWNLENC